MKYKSIKLICVILLFLLSVGVVNAWLFGPKAPPPTLYNSTSGVEFNISNTSENYAV